MGEVLDSALILKKLARTEKLSSYEITDLLQYSKVIKGILNEPFRLDNFTGLRKLSFLLLELSEIPYSFTIHEVQTLLDQLISATETSDSFSLRNGADGVLVCHQANLTLIMIRARRKKLANKGIHWILNYQTTKRGEQCLWRGCDLYQRFGGCIGDSPCYDGLVKSMKALSEYKRIYGTNKAIETKLKSGLEYIMMHRVCYHADAEEILYPDLIKLFYPYPYRTNVLETLHLLKQEGFWTDSRNDLAKKIVLAKRKKGGYIPEKLFMKSSWYPFEPINEVGPWLTDEVENLFEGTLISK